jgi:hypothetical protein
MEVEVKSTRAQEGRFDETQVNCGCGHNKLQRMVLTMTKPKDKPKIYEG